MKPSLLLLFFAAGLFGQLPDAAFFDNQVLHEIHLSANPTDWQTLKEKYLENTYYSSDFEWNGVTVRRIGIRSRGSGSRSPLKPNLTLSFDKYVSGQKFLGLSSVTLKANNQDASMMRESLAMQLYGHFGLPVPREAFTRVYMNGEFIGLYTIVEAITPDFLARTAGNNDGYLYEFNVVDAGYHFEYLGPSAAAYEMFEPKTHEKDPATASLIELIRRVNQTPDATFAASVTSYLNVTGFVTLVALEDFLADNDGVLSNVFGMNNFYLYRPLSSTVHSFIPWDSDLAFVGEQRPVLQGIQQNVLARRVLNVPEWRNLYLTTLLEAAAFAGASEGWMQSEVSRMYSLIGETARTEPHKQCLKDNQPVGPCDASDFEAGAAAILQFPAGRTPFIQETVGPMFSDVAPQLQTGAIVSVGPQQSTIAPGGLATAYGSGFATTSAQATTTPLPTELAGVRVEVNGIQAPLLFVSPAQINFQVPWSTPQGSVEVVVTANGIPSKAVQAVVLESAPAVLAVVRADDYTTAPVGPGESIAIYATGLGPVRPTPENGLPLPVGTDGMPAATVRIGDTDASVQYVGPAPGLIGVFQINATVPDTVAAGTHYDLVVQTGEQHSPPVTILTR